MPHWDSSPVNSDGVSSWGVPTGTASILTQAQMDEVRKANSQRRISFLFGRWNGCGESSHTKWVGTELYACQVNSVNSSWEFTFGGASIIHIHRHFPTNSTGSYLFLCGKARFKKYGSARDEFQGLMYNRQTLEHWTKPLNYSKFIPQPDGGGAHL